MQQKEAVFETKHFLPPRYLFVFKALLVLFKRFFYPNINKK
jgi:hypothetical protein